jgi:hypothetical protein
MTDPTDATDPIDPTVPTFPPVLGPAPDDDLATESEELSDEDAAAGDGADGPDDPPADTDPDSLLPVEGVDVDENVGQDGEAPEGTTLTDAERADLQDQAAAFEAANSQLPPEQRVSLDQVN